MTFKYALLKEKTNPRRTPGTTSERHDWDAMAH